MKRQAYQHPELRDENDNIIQQGAFGKNTALANATNDGWIDYVANDLEALHDAQTAAGNAITTGGLTVTGETSVPTANAGNSSKAIANTEYVQGELTNYLPLSGGTLTGVVNGVTPPNGDNSKKLATTEFVNAKVSVGTPTGVVQAFAGSTTPQGWLLCDGSAVSRTGYAALYSVIGTTYGAGNGSTTFNLPNLVDKFVEGSATSGTVKSAGLPNIKGETFILSANTYAAKILSTGAFYGITDTPTSMFNSTQGAGNPSAGTYNKLGFDAQKYNSIYSKSTTVQPPALTMRYIIKY